jgi:hypothetical protein
MEGTWRRARKSFGSTSAPLATPGAPPLPGQARQYSEVSIISALWRHGPMMARRMKDAGIPWPMFGGQQEVADLIAYLDSVQRSGSRRGAGEPASLDTLSAQIGSR